MARGEARGAPYAALRGLAVWTLVNLSYLRGRLILSGRDPDAMTMRDLLDVSWAVWVDGYNGMIDPNEIRQKLEAAFLEMWPDRLTWGEEAAARTPQAAMMGAQATPLSDDERQARRAARDARLAASQSSGRPARGTPPH